MPHATPASFKYNNHLTHQTMNKKNKLKLETLKLQSFVTDLNKGETDTLKGGAKTIKELCDLVIPSAYHSQCRTCEFHCEAVE
jgi:hypothetical protein